MRASGSSTRTGRDDSEASPISSNRPSCAARMPASKRRTVPAFSQSIGSCGASSPRSPRPSMRTTSSAGSETSTPSARTTRIAASVSAACPKPRNSVVPSAIAPSRTPRWQMPFTAGTATSPTSTVAGSIFTRPPRAPARRRRRTPAARGSPRRVPPPARRRRGSRSCRPARSRGAAGRSRRC